ncbi:LLM class flavin-dependent oxidoreductase [Mucilaginibacter ginkgonis]|uniref:Luciferase-like monooxygenase n=1 Tax=Mucilaginibacter ginkgonis TaxID=2682091 RepID=A0A6I4INC1_9SPHI|nr:LLM class flavin-dependent oxidoreductase [Mucilaginibacter ginkgonis]QQL49261.1 LLM class flavin-dependent oxidoreductase [Mucilaginibacter ginkgonis]
MELSNIKLSVLDQSPVRKGVTAEQALQETLELAKHTDHLGYHRFWVAEHHNIDSLAGSAPEVLMAHLAGQTKNIRIGSGGVMMPNHTALKVAENFKLLEALFPGRIDLGMGRAPGTDRLTASVLAPNNNFSDQDFVNQLFDLQAYFHNTAEAGTIQEKVKAIPMAATAPKQWLLSSSGGSVRFAAHFGTGFSFAHFINPNGGPEAVDLYRRHFKPSADFTSPQANVAIFIFVSDDPEKVKQHQALMDFRFLSLERGQGLSPVGYADIKDEVYTDAELERIAYNRKRIIAGNSRSVKEQITRLVNNYQVDEVIAITIAEEFDDRLQSYTLLKEVFKETENVAQVAE